ncbi:MAG: VCBS repeat-containing protein [Deltaproteobacteria bacterium]|nr:VCBS repeat-containing protein [Deltaproteobacteria bacterium]
MPQALAAGNFNMATLPDLAVANTVSNTVSVLSNNGAGLFATEVTTSTGAGSNPVGIAVADFNGDTVPDVITSNRGTDQIGVLLSNP